MELVVACYAQLPGWAAQGCSMSLSVCLAGRIVRVSQWGVVFFASAAKLPGTIGDPLLAVWVR
jgi:hypothetical protein